MPGKDSIWKYWFLLRRYCRPNRAARPQCRALEMTVQDVDAVSLRFARRPCGSRRESRPRNVLWVAKAWQRNARMRHEHHTDNSQFCVFMATFASWLLISLNIQKSSVSHSRATIQYLLVNNTQSGIQSDRKLITQVEMSIEAWKNGYN
jgi:hypothetical protein